MQHAITAPGTALGRILAIDHVTVPVIDLATSVAFYRDVLGLDLIEVIDRGRVRTASFRFGRGPALQLFVSASWPRAADDHPHWAFAIGPADVAEFQRRLARAGVHHVGPVRAGPLGAVSIYLHDPSGNVLELTATGYTGAVVT